MGQTRTSANRPGLRQGVGVSSKDPDKQASQRGVTMSMVAPHMLREPLVLHTKDRPGLFKLVATDSTGGVLTAYGGAEQPETGELLSFYPVDDTYGRVRLLARALEPVRFPSSVNLHVAVRWVAVTAAESARFLEKVLDVMGVKVHLPDADAEIVAHRELVYEPATQQVRMIEISGDHSRQPTADLAGGIEEQVTKTQPGILVETVSEDAILSWHAHQTAPKVKAAPPPAPTTSAPSAGMTQDLFTELPERRDLRPPPGPEKRQRRSWAGDASGGGWQPDELYRRPARAGWHRAVPHGPRDPTSRRARGRRWWWPLQVFDPGPCGFPGVRQRAGPRRGFTGPLQLSDDVSEPWPALRDLRGLAGEHSRGSLGPRRCPGRPVQRWGSLGGRDHRGVRAHRIRGAREGTTGFRGAPRLSASGATLVALEKGALTLKLAIIGDVHCAWGPEDVAFFDAADYDAVLFTGDLPGLRHGRAMEVAAAMAPLRTRAFMIPGNHDGPSLGELVADIAHLSNTNLLLAAAMRWRVGRLQRNLGRVELVGYSHHTVASRDGDAIGLIAVRPHSQGGHLNFAPYLRKTFQVASLQESAARLRDVIDDCPHERLVFLGHNGPHGLGGRQNDMWGADHKRTGGDWGDIDYRQAIDYARSSGRQVLVAVAGHMHQRTKQKQLRPWKLRRDDVLYVNAARVPRVFRHDDGAMRRYHVAVAIDGNDAVAEEVCI